MLPPKVSILLLCDDQRGTANTVLDHINAFLKFSRYRLYTYNPRNLPFNYFLDLNEFDVVVIHYSLAIISDYVVSTDLRRKIHDFRGLKIQYIQDDYRQVDQYTAMMRYLGIDVLFTAYPAEKIHLIYDEKRLPNVAKLTTLTGYVPDRFRNLEAPSLEGRPIEVGYRGRELPFWLGTLSQEKTWIGEGFLKHAATYKLRCDIAWKEQDRIYGKDWDSFISSCKTMLGTESGVSITDFDSSIEFKTREYLQANPHADFWEVYEYVLRPFEGNLVENTISPRVFECAAHRTAMILFPGEYSKILEPWVHYIPLQKDFSNIAEVVAKVRDIKFLNALTERTYIDLISSGRYSYQAMIQEFDQIVEQQLKALPASTSQKIRFQLAQQERQVLLFLKRSFGPVISKLMYLWRHLEKAVKNSFKRILPNPVYMQLIDLYGRIVPKHKKASSPDSWKI